MPLKARRYFFARKSSGFLLTKPLDVPKLNRRFEYGPLNLRYSYKQFFVVVVMFKFLGYYRCRFILYFFNYTYMFFFRHP